VATVVGEKLRRLGGEAQVLCISHLPQIAAAASTHFHIDKQVKGSRTVTTVRKLSPDDRVEEIARMMAGGAASAQVREGARELLAGAATPGPSGAGRLGTAKAGAGAKAKGESPRQAKAKAR
jgi:DNA repair ATPase RecN